MAVVLQGVPCPADGDSSIPWWWDRLAAQANELRLAGFSAVWLPPATKGALGTQSLGYDVFDDYDLGSKDQKGSIPTRYGTREQLQRCVAVLRANGLDVYLDLVENQRITGEDLTDYTFRYKDAFGNSEGGRFEKDPTDFHPFVPEDPGVFGAPRIKEITFGPDLAPIMGQPFHHVYSGLIDSADWMTRALDIQGYRVDDCKGISTDFLYPLLTSKSMAGKFAVGEFFDGSVDILREWVFDPDGMRGRCCAYDFPTRFMLAAMCNHPGHFNMAALDHAGLAGSNPEHAVTFVENHDTDTSPNLAPIVENKALAYAYILTSEGYPCVFYRDYSLDPGCYGLKPLIDNLIWIHEKLAAGPTQERWKDSGVFAYERLGGSHLLVGLNNDPDNERKIAVDTGFGSYVELHDYTGHAGNVFTDGSGRTTITIPRNVDGGGYVAYSIHGFGGGFEIVSHPVTQVFEGARDLDIRPAIEGDAVEVCRVWCEAHTSISAKLTFDISSWTQATCITLELLNPKGAIIGSRICSHSTGPETDLEVVAKETGFYAFQVRLTGAKEEPYALTVTYLAPQVFAPNK